MTAGKKKKKKKKSKSKKAILTNPFFCFASEKKNTFYIVSGCPFAQSVATSLKEVGDECEKVEFDFFKGRSMILSIQRMKKKKFSKFWSSIIRLVPN